MAGARKAMPNMNAPVGGTNAPVDTAYEEPRAVLKNSTDKTGVRQTANASTEAYVVRNWAVGLIVAAVILLWIFGGVVFKNASI